MLRDNGEEMYNKKERQQNDRPLRLNNRKINVESEYDQ